MNQNRLANTLIKILYIEARDGSNCSIYKYTRCGHRGKAHTNKIKSSRGNFICIVDMVEFSKLSQKFLMDFFF